MLNRASRKLLNDSSRILNSSEVPDIAAALEVELAGEESTTQKNEKSETIVPSPQPIYINTPVQTDADPQVVSIFKLKHDATMIHYYTGFNNFEHFMYFFNILGPASQNLIGIKTSLIPEDQLFLTLLKLRQAKDDIEIAFFFNIPVAAVSSTFVIWVNFLFYHQTDKLWNNAPSHLTTVCLRKKTVSWLTVAS